MISRDQATESFGRVRVAWHPEIWPHEIKGTLVRYSRQQDLCTVRLDSPIIYDHRTETHLTVPRKDLEPA